MRVHAAAAARRAMRLVGARAAQRRVMVTPANDYLPRFACISQRCVRLAGGLEARWLRRELRSVIR